MYSSGNVQGLEEEVLKALDSEAVDKDPEE